MTRRSWEVLFLCLVTFLLYANTLWNDFVWDDHIYIINNVWFQDSQYIPFYFTRNFCEGVEAPCRFYRPFISLSYLIDYSFWGLNPFGYHLTNIFIHILAVLGVYGLALGLLPFLKKNPSAIRNPEGSLSWMPFGSALIFAMHPIHVESVASIASRTDLPTAVFILFSMMGFMRWREENNRKRRIWYGASILFFILGLMTKEMAITLPFLLLAFDFLFVHKREKFQYQKLLSHIPYWIALGLYFVVRSAAMENSMGLVIPLEDILQRLFHIPALLMGYMSLMIFPVGLRLYHPLPSVEDHPIVDGLIPFLVLVILIYLGIRYRRSHPLLGFSLFWVCITLLPVLNLIPLSYPAVTERFSYISSIGFCLFVGYMISEGMVWLKKSRFQMVQRVVITALIFLGFVLSGLVVKRNYDWATNLTLWSKEIERSPYSSRTHYNYGSLLQEEGRLEDASTHYWDAIHLDPRDYLSYLNLAQLQERKGDLERGIYLYRESIRLAPRFYKTHYSLGTLLLIKGELDLAQTELETAIQLNPNFSMAYNNLGFVFFKKKEMEDAFKAFQNAVRTDPKNEEAHQNLGIAFKQKGDFQEAEQELLKAIALNPQLIEAHRSLGFLYLEELNRYEKALHHLLKVEQLRPGLDQDLERAIAKLKG